MTPRTSDDLSIGFLPHYAGLSVVDVNSANDPSGAEHGFPFGFTPPPLNVPSTSQFSEVMLRPSSLDHNSNHFNLKDTLHTDLSLDYRSPRRRTELYACPHCDANFTTRHNLKYHIMSHGGHRDYKCEGCAHRFGTLHVLKRHLKHCKGSPLKTSGLSDTNGKSKASSTPNSSKKYFHATPITSVDSSYTPAKDGVATELTGFGLHPAAASGNKGLVDYALALAEEDLPNDSGLAQKTDLVLETSSSVHTENTGSSQRSLTSMSMDSPPLFSWVDQSTSAQEQPLSREIEEEIAHLQHWKEWPFKALPGASPSSTAPGIVSSALPNSSGELEAWKSRDDTGLASKLPQTSLEETGKSLKLRRIVTDRDHYENKPRKKWTSEETQMLVEGRQKHGVGNWKAIATLKFDGRSPVDLKDRFRTYFPDAYKIHYPNARTVSTSSIWTDPSPHSASPPELALSSTSTKDNNGEMSLQHFHEERPHSAPYYLVEQPMVLPSPSELACAIEKKLGPFGQSRAPGSSPEPVGEVPDPPDFGYFLEITTPQIPTRHFPSDWILSLHRDWGWLPNIGGEKAPALDKRDISRFISRLLAEWAYSSPGAFHNANRFGMDRSSIVNAQYFHQTINNYWHVPTDNLLRDLHFQQQIEHLRKLLEDAQEIGRRNEDKIHRMERAFSDWQSLHRLETRLPPGPEPPPDISERHNESTDEEIYFDIREILYRIESSLPSLPGHSSKQELQGNPDRRICVQSPHTADYDSPHTLDFSTFHNPKAAQQTPAVRENPRRTKPSRFSHSCRRQYRYHPYGRPRSQRNSRVSGSSFSIHDVSGYVVNSPCDEMDCSE